MMANPEHAEIVRRGKDAIAEWRRCNPGKTLDLREGAFTEIQLQGADLSEADLSKAILVESNLSHSSLKHANLDDAILTLSNLTRANLRFSKLARSNLSLADLSVADFARANLSDASLALARLPYANLTEADLTGANLTGAVLTGATLDGTCVEGADFEHARMGRNLICRIDLSGAKNLHLIKHRGASSLAIDTLLMSKRTIPDMFLRGCGIPEELISRLKSLPDIDCRSSFISCTDEDKPFANRLRSRMRQERLPVWLAPREGQKRRERIFDAMRARDRLLLVLSQHSIRSTWIQSEIRRVRRRERIERRQILFPIRLVGTDAPADWKWVDAATFHDLASEFREGEIFDFPDWKNPEAFEAAFALLLRRLKGGSRQAVVAK